jgi:hypothetical protein
MTVILLPIFQQINCGPNDLCYYGKLEDTMRAFRDMDANNLIIWLSVLICFSIASFNAFGVTVTKNASSAQRSTIDTSRTLLIWLFFMWNPLSSFGVASDHFTFLQLGGFVLLVCGTLIFNEIVTVPFLGFDKNTKANREKHSKRALLDNSLAGVTEDEGADGGYMPVSPHAAYDASRNQRKIQSKISAAASKKGDDITIEETSHKLNPSFMSASSTPNYKE